MNIDSDSWTSPLLYAFHFADILGKLMQFWYHNQIWVILEHYPMWLENVIWNALSMQPFQYTKWGRCLCTTFSRWASYFLCGFILFEYEIKKFQLKFPNPTSNPVSSQVYFSTLSSGGTAKALLVEESCPLFVGPVKFLKNQDIIVSPFGEWWCNF